MSQAVTPRDYRRDGAQHIYGKNAHRIFKGKMPPLLQGVGTMQLELDHRGHIVTNFHVIQGAILLGRVIGLAELGDGDQAFLKVGRSALKALQ